MTRSLALIVLSLFLATPCGAQRASFTSDRPSPLQLIKPADPRDLSEKFSGSVQLSGRFSVAWISPKYLQVLFFPDASSSALLPYERGTHRVDMLHIANSERAARLFLDAATAQKVLGRELTAAEGTATVTIRNYESAISCDTRGYVAELVSASRQGEIVVGSRDERRAGC